MHIALWGPTCTVRSNLGPLNTTLFDPGSRVNAPLITGDPASMARRRLATTCLRNFGPYPANLSQPNAFMAIKCRYSPTEGPSEC